MQLITLNINWSLIAVPQRCYYRVKLPLETDERVLLELIKAHRTISHEELGVQLGFGLINIPDKNLFLDKAEVEIFSSLIQNLVNHRLIEKSKDKPYILSITEWGKEAIEDDTKYTFHTGWATILTNLLIEIDEHEESLFPYFQFDIPENEKCISWHDRLNIEEDYPLSLGSAHDQTARKKIRHYISLFTDENVLLDYVEKSQENVHHREIKVPLNITLIQKGGITDVELFTDDRPFTKLTSIIKRANNSKIYNQFKEQLEYKLYLNQADKIEAAFLKKYKIHVDWLDIIKDDRIVWEKELLDSLLSAEISTGDIWLQASSICPLHILAPHLNNYQDSLNWFKLTERFDVAFIIDNYTAYLWDTSILIKRASEEEIQQLLRLKLLEEEFTDWELIYSKLSDGFIKAHLKVIDFNFGALTRNKFELSMQCAVEYHELDWDWRYISRNAELHLLIQNLPQIGDKIDFGIFIERILNEGNESFSRIKNSERVLSFIKNALSKEDRNYWVNSQSPVRLDELRLSFLEQNELAIWGEDSLTGIEANKNLNWSKNLFLHYKHKVKSKLGYQHVSTTITEFSLIYEHQDFRWDFKALSSREDILNNFDFVYKFKRELNFEDTLNNIPLELIYSSSNFFNLWAKEMNKTNEFWNVLYQRVGFRSMVNLIACTDLKDLNLRRFWNSYGDNNTTNFHLCPSRLAELPEYEYFVQHMTLNAPFEYMIEYPELPWNKTMFTAKLIEEYDSISPEIIKKFLHQIDWIALIDYGGIDGGDLRYDKRLPEIAKYLNETSYEIQKKVWSLITRTISEPNLWDSIDADDGNDLFKWDWTAISSSRLVLHICSIDNLFVYAQKIDWKALSNNIHLHKSWTYNKSKFNTEDDWLKYVFSYLRAFQNYWDYEGLSNADSITWNNTIISENIDKWNWEILSLKSDLFVFLAGSDKLLNYKTLRDYHQYIDWGALSTRYDLIIKEKTIQVYSEKDWDWELLSGSPNLKLTISTLSEYQNKPWNWKALTRKKDLELKKEYFIVNEYEWIKCQDWDWHYLSKANWVDNKVLVTHPEKSWNWNHISTRQDILLDFQLVMVFLKKENISWDSVISNKKLEVKEEILTLLRKNIDITDNQWSILSSHPNLNFYTKYQDQSKVFDENYFTKFIDFWDWEMLIKHQKIDKNHLGFFKKHSEYINWNIVAKYFDISHKLIAYFGDKIDWYKVSENTSLNFSIGFIKKYYSKWKWHLLLENTRVKEDKQVLKYVKHEVNSIPLLRLINRLYQKNSSFKGYVYHYTHLANAIKIMQEQKIKSRIDSDQFNNSAGTVWESNNRPQKYARFYFRPLTPNQFYNEGLGASGEKSYAKWAQMDFPKCPEPVFFQIDLYAFLDIENENIMLSNGNMQRRATRFGPLDKMVDNFNYDLVYHEGAINGDRDATLNAREQELLVEKEYCFASTPPNAIKIITNSENSSDTIKNIPGISAKLLKRIIVNSVFFIKRGIDFHITKSVEKEDRRIFKAIDHFKFRVFFNGNTINNRAIYNGKITRPPWKINGYTAFEIEGGFELSKDVVSTVTLYDEQPHRDENKQDWLIFTNDFENWEDAISLLGKKYAMNTLLR